MIPMILHSANRDRGIDLNDILKELWLNATELVDASEERPGYATRVSPVAYSFFFRS